MPDLSASHGALAAALTVVTGWVAKIQFRPDPRVDRILTKLDDQSEKIAEQGERLARIEGRLDQ